MDELIGRTIESIREGTYSENQSLIFKFEDDSVLEMYHKQDCCESVWLAETIGDLQDLIGVPLLEVYKTSSSKDRDYGTSTWTFYRFRTAKGPVTFRWVGESNGYYSESVDVYFETPDGERRELC